MASRQTQVAALRTKNRELVQALDASRQETSKLFVQNLELKKERQQLMERVSNLETRLSQLLPIHSTQQSLAKFLHDMEQRITYARSLLVIPPTNPSSSSLSLSSSLLPFSPIHPHLHHSSSSPVPQEPAEQDMETDQSELQYNSILQSTGLYTNSIISNTENITENKSFASGRPRRACTSLVQSYHETSLQNKLRRDVQSERGAKKRTRQETPAVEKKRVGKITTRIKNRRAGLQDITNKLDELKE